jgi:hypothetical protein
MAKSPQKYSAKKAKDANEPKEHSMVWLQGLLCGALVTLAPPTALLLGVLLAPALVAVLLDRQPGRPVARSVALCAMAASVAPLRTLWLSGHTVAGATALTVNLHIVAVAWSAAAGGWLLAEAAPIAVRAVLEAASLSRTARLRGARARLVEDWGLEPPAAQRVSAGRLAA